MMRRHHPAEQAVPLDRIQDVQHPGRPSGSEMRRIRLQNGQRHLVRLVLRAVDIRTEFRGIRGLENLQGQSMGNGEDAGEMIGLVVVLDGDAGGTGG